MQQKYSESQSILSVLLSSFDTILTKYLFNTSILWYFSINEPTLTRHTFK